MTRYDPNRKIPTVTPEIRLRLAERHAALWKEPVDGKLTYNERFDATEKKLTDAEWFEVLFIADLLAAVQSPRKTVGDTWRSITLMAKTSTRVNGWSEAKMQQHIAAAADKVIRLMSA